MHTHTQTDAQLTDTHQELLFGMLCSSSIHSFIHSGHVYSASSSQLLLRSTPDTAQILCRSFKPNRHRQLRVKDLPKVPTWQIERDSNPRPSGRKGITLPMYHHIPSSSLLSISVSMTFSSMSQGKTDQLHQSIPWLHWECRLSCAECMCSDYKR